MLILTRNLGETIRINDDIEITFLGMRGRQARIGIEAPEDVIIHRSEIYDRIHAENTEEDNQND